MRIRGAEEGDGELGEKISIAIPKARTWTSPAWTGEIWLGAPKSERISVLLRGRGWD